MKIKLNVSEERYAELEAFLTSHGFTISDDAEFLLQERERGISFLNAKRGDLLCRIRTEEIVCIESYGKSVILRTMDGEYNISERLKELEQMLDGSKFMRISNSVIIAKNCVAKIKPTFSTKFILTMKNGTQVDVTRSYYYRFREAYGI
ncbi:MAG: LytTR family transcriptional regulator [Oscillospiraceae bacterium]|nr:LytTR family transcriptional regulator [Oscillospiraceae bacterium]